MLELLKRIKHSSIRPQPFLRHDLFKRDQVPHVERAGVGRAIVGRVEVHDGAFAADGGEELLHAVAVGGLAGAGGADDQLGEGHGGCSVPLRTRWPPEFVTVVCGVCEDRSELSEVAAFTPILISPGKLKSCRKHPSLENPNIGIS